MPFTVSDESGTLTGERVITAALPQCELDRSCGDASWRTFDGGSIAGGSMHALLQPTRRRTQQVCRRWCQL